MIKKILFPLLLSVTSFAQCAYANNDTPKFNFNYYALKKDISDKNYTTAWQSAQSLQEEHLGEPAFDFLYGVAALANNKAEYAVFAFERVTANEPNWLDAQYLLAKSNYSIANYQAAINTSEALINNPKTSVTLKQSAQTLATKAQAKLDKQSFSFNQQVSLGFGRDSNINSGTSEDNIFLPFLGQNVPLSQNSQETADNYASLSYLVSGNKVFSQVSKLFFFGVGNLHTYQDESQFKRITGNISVKYQHTFDIAKVAVGVNVLPLWLDGDFYRTRSAITTDIEKQLSTLFSITAGVSVGETNNKINNALNTNDTTLNLFAHYYTGNVKHSLGVNYLTEKSKQEQFTHNSSDIVTFSYSNLWLINSSWLARSMVGFQQREFKGPHPFFLEERDDEMWLASLSVDYTPSKNWTMSLNANAQDKSSNLDLFSYKRTDISLKATMNF